MNSCQLQSMDEEAIRFRMKHQRLIQEFLDLQKDFVSKKKIQIAQKKRDALLAEVRFLRQKHSYLMDLHSNSIESKQEFLSPEKSSMENENVGKSLKVVKKKIKDRVTVTINKTIKNL